VNPKITAALSRVDYPGMFVAFVLDRALFAGILA